MNVDVKVAQLEDRFADIPARQVTENIVLTEPGKVLLGLTREQVQEFVREGNDLVVITEEGQAIRIVNFYMDPELPSELYLVDDEGQAWLVGLEADPAQGAVWAEFTSQSEWAGLEALPAGGVERKGVLALGAALLAVGGAALLDGSSGGSSKAVADEDDAGGGVAPSLVISEAADGYISAAELADGIQATVGLTPATRAGDIISLIIEDGENPATEVRYTVSEADVAAGSVTITIPGPLADANYSVTAVITDGAGNTSAPSDAVEFTIDTEAPSAPTAELADDADGDGITGDGTVNVGNLEDGGSWQYSTDGGQIWVDGDGSSFVLEDGSYADGDVQVRQTDAAGNTSDPVTLGPVTIDSSPGGEDGTDAPTLTIAEADDGFINADEMADGIAAVVTLTSGTRAGDTITLLVDDGVNEPTAVTYTVTADDIAAGSSTIIIPGPLADADYSVTAVISDEAGNASAPSDAVEFTVDTLAPDAPTAELANDTGDADGITSDGTVNVGNLEDGGSWQYSTDGGQTWTDGEGTSFELEEGEYAEGDVQVRQTDAAGNVSEAGSLGSVTVDSSSPGGEDGTDAPTLTIAEADDGFINADELADGIAAVVTLTPGTRAGDTITLLVDDGVNEPTEVTYTVTADDIAAGSSTITIPGPLADADYSVTAEISDAVGNNSAPSNPVEFTVDTEAPAAPTAELADDADGDGITSDGTVNVGNLEDGGSWQYSTDGGQTWVDGEGTSFELEEGEYADGDVQVRQTDEAGNTSDPVTLGPVTVDTTSPGGEDGTDAPTLAIAEADDGFINADELADGIAAVVTLTPGTSAGDTITLLVDDGVNEPTEVTYTVTADDIAAGSSSITIPGPLADADYSVTAEISDAVGNNSAPSNPVEFTVDTEAPSAPTAELADDADGDGITGDGTVNVGNLEDGGSWQYSTDGGQTWVDGEGTSFELEEGEYAEGDVQVRQTDEAGNTSDPVTLGPITVDTTSPGGEDGTDAPTLAIAEADDGFINADELADGIAAVVTLTPGTRAGDTITLLVDDGVNEPTEVTYTVTADDIAAGSSTIIIPGPLADADYSVTAEISDAVGNNSAPSNPVEFTVDTEAPSAPTAELADDTDGDGITGDGTVNVGNLEDGGSWQYSTDGGQTWVDGDGTSFELEEGEYAEGDVQVRQTDAAGNTSDPVTLGPITVDTTSPGGEDGTDAPELSIVEADDGFINADELADGIAAEVTLTPGTSAGDTITLLVDDGVNEPTEVTYTVTADDIAAGSSAITIPGPLADADYSVTAVISDAVGNTSAPSDAVEFTVDTLAPDAPTAELADDADGDGITGDGTVNVGNLEDGGSWQYSTDGGQTWVDGEGTSFELEEGEYAEGDVQVRQTDKAGNTSDPVTLGPITVDTTSPGGEDGTDAPELSIVEADDGFINADELADGIAAEVTLTPGTSAGDTITLLVDDGVNEPTEVTYTVTADDIAAGSSTIIIPGPLADADYSVTAEISDAVGNNSAPSNPVEFTVDTEAPSAPTAELADDADGDGITGDGTVNVGNLEDGGSWQYSTDGGQTWVDGDGSSFVLEEGSYADGDVQVRQADEAGNTSDPVTLGPITVDTTSPGGEDGTDAPTLAIAEADDGFINADELADGIAAEVTLTPGTSAGDTITLLVADGVNPATEVSYIVSEADVAAGTATVTIDPLADGDYSVTAVITDAVGNSSATSDAVEFTVDTLAPDAPTAELADDADGDGITGDGTVNVGNLEDGGSWQYSTDGGQTWVDGEGTSFELEEGEYAEGDVQVRQTDEAGNTSDPVTLGPITVDTTSPGGEDGTDAPELSIVEADDGFINADELADGIAAEVTLTPGTSAGDTITLLVDDGVNEPTEVTYIVTADDIAAGSSTITIPGPLADADYNVTAVITDGAGNSSATSDAVEFTVDTLAPDAPTAELADDVDGDGITSDGTVNVGNLEDGGSWQYSTDGGQTWVDGEGTSFELEEGEYAEGDVQVRQTDEAGNTSDPVTLGPITVDTTSPGGEDGTDAPELSIVEADDGFINADELADGIAAEVTLTPGTSAGDTITLLVDDGVNPATEVSYIVSEADVAAGTATVTIDPLVDGDYNVTAVITDGAGNSSATSDAVEFTVDTLAPEAPTAELADDADSDGITGDGTVNVGNLEDGGSWQYSTDGGQTWTDGEGTSFELEEGEYAEGDVQVRQTDEAGNTSDPVTLGPITVDTTSPGGEDGTDAPTLTIAEADDGFINADELADGIAAVVTLTPGTSAGDTITLLVDDGVNEPTEVTYTVTADDIAAGSSTITIPGPLADADYSVTAEISDAVGNTSAPSDAVEFTVDTLAPEAPTAELADDADGDGITGDGTVNVGNLEDGGSWQYSTDGGQTWVDGEGTSFELEEGEYAEGDVQVRQTDEAGNTSDPVTLGPITVDTTSPGGEDGTDAPTLTIAEADDGFINADELADGIAAEVTLTPGTSAGDTITLLVDDGVNPATEVSYIVSEADVAAGTATVTIDPLADGDYSVTAVITDPVGNSSATSDAVEFTVDTLAPEAPTAELADDADGDGITGDGTVNVGNLEDGGSWQYSTDGGQTWTDGEGTSFELEEGEYAEGDVQVRQTDAAGNTSESVTLGPITVDTTSPGGEDGTDAPELSIVEADDGFINADELADGIAAEVTLTPGTSTGDTITLLVDDGVNEPTEVTYTVTAEDVTGGTATVTIDSLADGDYNVTAVITDGAGNSSATSDAVEFTVDTLAPEAPTAELANDTGDADGITSDGTVNIGNLEDGASWQYSTDGGQTWVDGEGTSFELEEGEYAAGDVQVRQIDASGNTGASGSAGAMTVTRLVAADDSTSAEFGPGSVIVNAPTTVENVQALGLLESEWGVDAMVTLTVSPDHVGEVVINVHQVALLAVADAFVLEVYDQDGQRVYAGATEGTLVGDIAGLEILGLTGDNGLTATLTGLPPGEYSVVVRNDQSRLAGLLDPDGGGLSLQELGDAGVVLGPNNQQVILDTIEDALNGTLIGGSVGLGTFVRNILEPLLDTTTAIGAGELVGILTEPLQILGIPGVLDSVLGLLSDALLSNTLTAFQFTNITTSLTEYAYSGELSSTGNVIEGDGVNGADQVVSGTVVTAVTNSEGETQTITDDSEVIQLAGVYGMLEMAADGSYRYTAYDPSAIGETEQFVYTISDGTNTDSATLTIIIEGGHLPPLAAEDDHVALDLGSQVAEVGVPVSNSNVKVLGLLEGGSGEITGVPLTVREDYLGEVVIEVSQKALLAVASAFAVYVVNAAGEVVFTAVTEGNPLLGDVAGLGVLGLTGSGTLVTTVPDLAPGDYTVVVGNDQGALGNLLSGLSLQQLGENGVILSEGNQELVLDAVEAALGGNTIAATARGVLEVALGGLNGLGVDRLVDVVTKTLTTLGLPQLVETVLGSIAAELVSNTLTLLQVTNITTTLTEFNFTGDLQASGNVITGAGEGDVADAVISGGVVTQVANSAGDTVTVLGTGDGGVTIQGLYGVLTIYQDGTYNYQLTGARSGLGKTEVFTYTVTNGAFDKDGTLITEQATLSVEIAGEGVASDVAFAGIEYEHVTGPGVAEKDAVGFSWLFGIGGAVLWMKEDPLSEIIRVAENTTQDLTITIKGELLSIGGNTSVYVEKEVDGVWQTVEFLDNDRLFGLLGLGSGGEFTVSGLGAGDYRVRMEVGTGLLGLPGSIGADISTSVTYLDQFLSSAIDASGDLLANDLIQPGVDGLPQDFVLSISNGGEFEAIGTGALTLAGTYGSLTVNPDGTYVYTPDSSLPFSSEIQTDVFAYRLEYGDGRVEEAELTVFVRPSGAGVDEAADGDAAMAALAFAWEDDSIIVDIDAAETTAMADTAEAGFESVAGLLADDAIELHDMADELVIEGGEDDTLNIDPQHLGGSETWAANGQAYSPDVFGDSTLLMQDTANVEV